MPDWAWSLLFGPGGQMFRVATKATGAMAKAEIEESYKQTFIKGVALGALAVWFLRGQRW